MTNSSHPIDRADLGADASTTPVPFVLGWLTLLVLATAALYFPSLGGELVYDDLPLVDSAPATQSISAAFGHILEPFWAFNNAESETQRGIWRPLTSLALAVGRTVQGGSPLGFHLISLLLHIGSTILAFKLAVRLLASRAGVTNGLRLALGGTAVALLFAFHPAQVEAVAWISAVNDPLWGFLGLGALLSYERALQKRRAPWFAGVLIFLALCAKEQALVLPIIVLVLNLTARSRPTRSQIMWLALAVGAWYATRVSVFNGIDAGLFRDYGDFGFSAGRELSFRVELAGGFLSHLFWPDHPAVFRPVHPVLPEGSHAVLAGALWLVGALGAAAIALLRGKRTVAAGVLLALLVLAPFVVSPDKAGLFPESDRYLYMAVFGAALAVVAILARFRSELPLVVVTALALIPMARISWAHQDTFENELAFRDAAVEDAPRSPNVRWGAGRAYIAEYIRTRDTDTLGLAYIHYLHSLKSVTVYGDGSFVDDESKSLPERIAWLERLIIKTPVEHRRLDPTVFATTDDRFQATLGQITSNLLRIDVSKNPDLEYPLLLVESASTILDWGQRPEMNSLKARIHLRRGETQAAKEAIALAIQAAPFSIAHQVDLSRILMREGDFEGARVTLQRASERMPQNQDLRLEYATAALESRRYEITADALQVVLAEQPKNVRALVLKASLESLRKRPTESLRYLDRALHEDPNDGMAHKERGRAMYQLDDLEGALEGFSNAARLMPDDFEAHYNVASLLLGQHPGPDASKSALESWHLALEPVLVRAYMLAPPTSQQQIGLQEQLEGLIGRNPNQALTLSTQLKLQKRNALALIWANKAVTFKDAWPEEERDSNLVLAYTLQGQLSLGAGLLEDAVNAFRNAVLIDDSHFAAQFELSDLLVQTGRANEARTPTEKALELLPKAGVAPEMMAAIKGTLEQNLLVVEAASAMGPAVPR